MSNRSSKLLLEVADTFDLHAQRHPHMKMAGCTDVMVSPPLIDEVRTWAKGYRDFMSRPRKPKLLGNHLERARDLLEGCPAQRQFSAGLVGGKPGLPPGLFLVKVDPRGSLSGISEVPIEYY